LIYQDLSQRKVQRAVALRHALNRALEIFSEESRAAHSTAGGQTRSQGTSTTTPRDSDASGTLPPPPLPPPPPLLAALRLQVCWISRMARRARSAPTPDLPLSSLLPGIYQRSFRAGASQVDATVALSVSDKLSLMQAQLAKVEEKLTSAAPTREAIEARVDLVLARKCGPSMHHQHHHPGASSSPTATAAPRGSAPPSGSSGGAGRTLANLQRSLSLNRAGRSQTKSPSPDGGSVQL
jgi:hypothetical protein